MLNQSCPSPSKIDSKFARSSWCWRKTFALVRFRGKVCRASLSRLAGTFGRKRMIGKWRKVLAWRFHPRKRKCDDRSSTNLDPKSLCWAAGWDCWQFHEFLPSWPWNALKLLASRCVILKFPLTKSTRKSWRHSAVLELPETLGLWKRQTECCWQLRNISCRHRSRLSLPELILS